MTNCNPTKCRDCCGNGKDPEGFFDRCRRCQGSGLAADEHCIRCGKRGQQCKPFVMANGGINYCGID